MESQYGSKWCYPDPTNEENALTDTGRVWIDEFGGYTLEHLGETIRNCLQAWTEWPPTLPQIRMELKAAKLPSRQAYKALPKPDQRKELGLAAIADIRVMLAEADSLSAEETQQVYQQLRKGYET